jgi:hypothetical protein
VLRESSSVKSSVVVRKADYFAKSATKARLCRTGDACEVGTRNMWASSPYPLLRGEGEGKITGGRVNPGWRSFLTYPGLVSETRFGVFRLRDEVASGGEKLRRLRTFLILDFLIFDLPKRKEIYD